MAARRIIAALLPLALALPAAAAATRGKGGPRHPDVAAQRGVQDCDECHRGATPAVVSDWEAGQHGTGMVKCLVCHGSTGADFTLAPPPERCRGCHAGEVASVTPPRGKPVICFSCHTPHRLAAPGKASPHARP